MSRQDDLTFWRECAEQAREVAACAITPEVRQFHLDRAERYAAQMRDAEPAINRSDTRSV